MLHNSDGAMLAKLLGLLILSSLCSAMIRSHTTIMDDQGEGSGVDHNTHSFSTTDGEMSYIDPMGPPMLPPPGHIDNMTDASNVPNLRMIGENIPNMAICEMLLNAPGPLPADQMSLLCHCLNCKGTVGPKGDQGDRGPPGPPGSPGRRGVMGFRGPPGFTGSQGMKGQKGDLGEKGQSGMTGFTGTKGERGFKGEKGDRGLMGFTGAQGPQGEAGTCPASCESVQGPPGQQGIPGPVGGRGLPGVPGPMGPKGFKGDMGDLGRPGTPGMNGEKGDQGEQGMCECEDGADGRDGRAGDKGDRGEKGDTGAQGVQGPIGLKGSMGDMGVRGLPGPCSPAIQSAFSACINQSYPLQNSPVPFNHVLTNKQGHFNPTRGIYTAPVNGTYVFSFHLAVAGKILKVGVFVNFRPVVKTTEATTQSTTSQTIVIHLKMGDRVWLQVKDATTNGMYTDSESSSTFSGYLLHPDSCDIIVGRMFIPAADTDDTGDYSWDGPGGTDATTTTPSP